MTLGFEIKEVTGKGLGLFATKDFSKGMTIEACPVIVLTPEDRKRLINTPLDNYIYPWNNERDACMVLGYGSLINHAYKANADWKPDVKNKIMLYVAVKDIKKGEEITVNYNGFPEDDDKIDWFEYKN